MDNLDSPALWGLIWLGLGATLVIIEIVAIGGFFLIPFAIGAIVAAVASFLGLPVPFGFGVFLLASLGSFFLLQPLAARLNRALPAVVGVGANRLIGDTGEVLSEIPTGVAKAGMVKVAGEEWRAEGRDGMGIMAGTLVSVVEVKGTRVIVEPTITNSL